MNYCTISSVIETCLELSISKYEEIIIQKVEVFVAFTKRTSELTSFVLSVMLLICSLLPRRGMTLEKATGMFGHLCATH